MLAKQNQKSSACGQKRREPFRISWNHTELEGFSLPGYSRFNEHTRGQLSKGEIRGKLQTITS